MRIEADDDMRGDLQWIAVGLAVMAAMLLLLFCGCTLTRIEWGGEEPVLNPAKTAVLGIRRTPVRIYNNRHWMDTDIATGALLISTNGEIRVEFGGYSSTTSSNLTALVDTSLRGAAELAAKIGAAIATSGGSCGAESISAMVKRYLDRGGSADKAQVDCADGKCTVSDGTVSESCPTCSEE